jgi:hypothetical protein
MCCDAWAASASRLWIGYSQNAVLIVLSLDGFMYRAATRMCMPVHDDAETARRAALAGES